MHDIGIFKSKYKALNREFSWGIAPKPRVTVLLRATTSRDIKPLAIRTDKWFFAEIPIQMYLLL